MTATGQNTTISGKPASEIRLEHDVILYDGHCNLCNRWVQWVLKRDQDARYRFASLQSEVGRTLIEKAGRNPDSLDSVVLWRAGKVWIKSGAALRIATGLGGLYRLAQVGFIFPGLIRDGIYNWIARNRYRWFGRSEECPLPRPEWRTRFLDN